MASPDASLTQVVIAEYVAVRSEITSRLAAQDVMINLFMTATAAVVGFALSDQSRLLLLLILPPLSLAVRLLYQNHNIHIGLAARYIDDELRPLAARSVGDEHVLRWESWYTAEVARARRLRIPHRWALRALFLIPAAVALLLVLPGLREWWAWAAWAVATGRRGGVSDRI